MIIKVTEAQLMDYDSDSVMTALEFIASDIERARESGEIPRGTFCIDTAMGSITVEVVYAN